MTSRDPATATSTPSLGTVAPIGLRIGRIGRPITGNLRRHWPLVASLLLLWAIIAAILKVSLEQNQGQIIYDVDDPYIHMAIAKNLVEHGVWGITKYEFSSSSSSIIWPLLLFISYSLFGINDATPFIINIVVVTCTVVAMYLILVKYSLHIPRVVLFVLVSVIIFATPIPALVFSGHEHVLHTMLTVIFVYAASGALSLTAASRPLCHSERPKEAKNLASDSAPRSTRTGFFVDSLLRMTEGWRSSTSSRTATIGRSASVSLFLLAPLLTSTRYEGIFPVAVACGLFFLQCRWRFGLALGALAALPVVVYGTISVASGWYWLPTPLS